MSWFGEQVQMHAGIVSISPGHRLYHRGVYCVQAGLIKEWNSTPLKTNLHDNNRQNYKIVR